MTKLVADAISFVGNIIKKVDKFKANNNKCKNIRKFVNTLNSDLKLLQQAPIMEDKIVRRAMSCLKDALKSTETDVMKCQDTKALLRILKANTIAATLDPLRQNLAEKMIRAILATVISTRIEVHNMRREMHKNFKSTQHNNSAATRALLVPLQRSKKHIGDHASGENRKEKKKTGLIKYTWSDLEDVIGEPSKQVIIGGDIKSSSVVYEVKIDNEPVAIKEFRNFDASVKECFVKELNIVSKLQHRNIVKLVGYCYEDNESLVQKGNSFEAVKIRHLAFVSRYMNNRRLMSDVIQGNKRVDWPDLFRIIEGIAKGVHYLHEQGIVYLDLKPENILLDADKIPKINNFRKATVLKLGANKITLKDAKSLPGSRKYMAPELYEELTASTKSDVYSFGVIILEVMSLMCATSERGRPKGPKEWAQRMQECDLSDLFDKVLVTGNLELMLATRCVLVGLECCRPDDLATNRPSMQEVVFMLAGSHMEEVENKDKASSSGSHANKGKKKKKGEQVPAKVVVSKGTSAPKEGRTYEILTEEKLRCRQDEAMDKVREVIPIIPMGVVEVLLRDCHWKPERVQEAWFGENNGHDIRQALGLPLWPDEVTGPKVDSKFTCGTCHGVSMADASQLLRSAGCSHYYCNECWCDYIRTATDSVDCLSLKCPVPSCRMPVIRELVQMVVDDETMKQYDWYARRSYVHHSGGTIKWCPGCSVRAIKFLGCGSGGSMDVVCECNHKFCWSCKTAPHSPVPCNRIIGNK